MRADICFTFFRRHRAPRAFSSQGRLTCALSPFSAGPPFPEGKGNSLRFNFFNPAPRWTKHLRRPECECGKEGRADFEHLWGLLPAEHRAAT
jgi:hypothetical protein